jgi:hypothetical protein
MSTGQLFRRYGGWLLVVTLVAAGVSWLGFRWWRGSGEVKVAFQWKGQAVEIENPPAGTLLVGGRMLPVPDFSDGKAVSTTLEAGRTYPIVFSHPWLLSQTSIVSVAKGQVQTVNMPIATLPITLFLVAPVSGTILEWDGERHSTSEDRTIALSGLQPGQRHHVAVSASGYRPINREIVLSSLAPLQTNFLEMERMAGQVSFNFDLMDVEPADKDWLLKNSSPSVEVAYGKLNYSTVIGKSLLITNQAPGAYTANISSGDYVTTPEEAPVKIENGKTAICSVTIRPKAAILIPSGIGQIGLKVTDEFGNASQKQHDGFLIRPGLRVLRLSASGYEDAFITNYFFPRRETAINVTLTRHGHDTLSRSKAEVEKLLTPANTLILSEVLSAKWQEVQERLRQLEQEASSPDQDLDIVAKGFDALAGQMRGLLGEYSDASAKHGMYVYSSGQWMPLLKTEKHVIDRPAEAVESDWNSNTNDFVLAGRTQYTRTGTPPAVQGQNVVIVYWQEPMNLTTKSVQFFETNTSAKIVRFPTCINDRWTFQNYLTEPQHPPVSGFRTAPATAQYKEPRLVLFKVQENLPNGDYGLLGKSFAYLFHVANADPTPSLNVRPEPAIFNTADIPNLPGLYLKNNYEWRRLPQAKVSVLSGRVVRGIIYDPNGPNPMEAFTYNYNCDVEIPFVKGDNVSIVVQKDWMDLNDSIKAEHGTYVVFRLSANGYREWTAEGLVKPPSKVREYDWQNILGIGKGKLASIATDIEPNLHAINFTRKLSAGYYGIYVNYCCYLFKVED